MSVSGSSSLLFLRLFHFSQSFFVAAVSFRASISSVFLRPRPRPRPHHIFTHFFFLFHRNPQPTHSHIRRYTKNTILIHVPSLESPPCRSPGLCLVSLSSLPTHAYPLNSAPAAAPALLCLSFIHCLSLVRLLCCAVFLAREVFFPVFSFFMVVLGVCLYAYLLHCRLRNYHFFGLLYVLLNNSYILG